MKDESSGKNMDGFGAEFAKLVLRRHTIGVTREVFTKDIDDILAQMTTPKIREMILKQAEESSKNEAVIFAYKIDTRKCGDILVHNIMVPNKALQKRYHELGIKSLKTRLTEYYPAPLEVHLRIVKGWAQVYVKWPHYSEQE